MTKGKYKCNVFASYFNSIINGFYDVNGLKCYKSKPYMLANNRYYLRFHSSLLQKSE